MVRFNPPGGFGAFGTHDVGIEALGFDEFQSAGRIWGFRNVADLSWADVEAVVSIRRADLGLSEQPACAILDTRPLFQSAGRIWGFRNLARDARRRPGISIVSIRRADLGLSEPRPPPAPPRPRWVSIRRADLGLSEPGGGGWSTHACCGFNPPGGFGAFGTGGRRGR